MSLAEDKMMIEVDETDLADTAAAVAEWEHFPASSILHHGRRCCRVAREWLFSMDYSQLGGGDPLTGPRWIARKYPWGPSRWPISWCEAVEQKNLDCGALAALAAEVFAARGVRAYPAQFIQQFTEDATRHWQMKWDGEGCTVRWIKGDVIYHEGCAVVSRDGEIKLWDASAGWWLNPRQFGGYGGLLALRVFAPEAEAGIDGSFAWGEHRIAPNRWQKIERGRTAAAAASVSLAQAARA